MDTLPNTSNSPGRPPNRRRLFCELSPMCYRISVWKGCLLRSLRDFLGGEDFAHTRAAALPCLVYRHQSLIRRKLGDVNPVLQDNKAVNLALAAPCIDGVVIRPGQVFSLWRLVGRTSERRGFRNGLMIRQGQPSEGIGGGLCQLSNLIHWMVLHSPLQIVEHHHHDGIDMFPDFGRQVPFGVGTSISYNYLDYRFKNPTNQAFQLNIWTDDAHLHGELRCETPLDKKFHVVCENEFFAREADGNVYRCNEIYRYSVDKATGQPSPKTLVKRNHARLLYAPALVQLATDATISQNADQP